MSTIFTLLFAIISLNISSLPLVEYDSYLSNDFVRADRLISSEAESKAPIKKDIKSLGPQLSAQKAIVVDKKSGAVLFAKEEKEKHSMASITKLITVLVFLETEPNLDQRFEMIKEDDREGAEKLIQPGESAKLHDYLISSLLGSANNATIALTRSTGISTEEFVKKMNQKAKELKMYDTFFVEPSGLDPKNKSTALDMVKLLNAVESNDIIHEITGMYSSNIVVYPSGIRRNVLTTNHLMGSIVFVEFGKTGYLDESLYNLATTVSTSNGNELYIVILGSQTNEERVQDAKNLSIWAQRVYSWE